ncbi:Uncharacterised protein [Starkeya nomas]|uniref:Autotransporter domain-containing protein n=2 Tax=Starkeya nomas TaxID=2666134 RepID=A0A5S9NMT9_9HYPH|nr:Uncharacterised protein [Starkeya nomas]
MAQQMGTASLGTFHERRGDQSLLDNLGIATAAWGRVFGGTHDQSWSSTVAGPNYQLAPEIDGDIWGLQVGLDLIAYESGWGQERLGLFYTHADASGSVYGNTLAIVGNRAGSLSLQGDSIGGYWTHIGPTGWYLDAVAMYTWLGGSTSSIQGVGIDTDGNAIVASLEGGVPFTIADNWTLEPQAQPIWQRVDFDDTRDLYSAIDFQSFDAFTGRLGLRLEGTTVVQGAVWQPFISVDLWHTFSQSSDVVFNGTNVGTELEGTSLEVRGGVSIRLTPTVAAFGSVDYTTGLSGETQRSVGGNLGIRVRW